MAKKNLINNELNKTNSRPEEIENNDTHNGHKYVDIGIRLGGKKILFATCNFGAENPEDFGNFLTFDEAREAVKKWGNEWEVPSKETLEALLSDTVKGKWVKNYKGTSKSGYRFTGKGSFSSALLFLPAAGYYDPTPKNPYDCDFDQTLYDAGDCGCYWSRSLNAGIPDFAWYLHFNELGCIMSNSIRCNSVRPVLVFPE